MQPSATPSRATSPSGETIQLESDDEPSTSTSDSNSRAGPSEAQATSDGGAVAGPGPSSMKRPPSPSINPQPPIKKKRGRQSAASVNPEYHPLPLPHSAMTRVQPATNNSPTNRHVLYINPGVTDASRAKWPAEHEFDKQNRVAGKPSWYETVAKTDRRHKALLERVGDELAIKLQLVPKGTTEHWILDSLPQDYLFTIHHSVTGSNQSRLDPYVFGPPVTAKFRSADEIIPHLYWLIEHGPNDKLRCQCKYCTKKSQSDVNRVDGLSDTRTSSVPPTASVHGGGGGPAAVQARVKRLSNLPNSTSGADKGKKPKLKPKPEPTMATAGSETPQPDDEQTEAITSTTEATAPEAVAEEEKPPVRSRTFNSDSPEPSFSGAFVDKQRDSDLLHGAKFRFGEMVWVQIPQGSLVPVSSLLSKGEGGQGEGDAITHWPAIIQHREERTESTLCHPYTSGSDAIPQFFNTKRWVYDVIYLGTRNQATGVEEDDVKNWLGSSGLPDRLWDHDKLLNRDTVEMIWDGTRMSKVELGELVSLEQAVAPLAFALQIAAHVMSSFSLVDRYIVKDGHFVLADDMTDSVRREIERAKDNWFYQSMYLGSELIWVNDFVRIIHHRDAKLPPRHSLSRGSEDRALFMRVQAIWKDQESRLVKLTGQVYELRDLRDDDNGHGAGSGTVGSMSVFLEKTPSSQAVAASTGIHPVETEGGVGGGGGGGLASKEPKTTERPVDETSTPPQPSTSPPSPSPSSSTSDSAFYSTPLPPAPEGFEFNRVTPGESQVTLELEYLAGRYYPLAPGPNHSRQTIDRVLEQFPCGPAFGGSPDADARQDESGVNEGAGGNTRPLTDLDRAVALAGLIPAIRLYCKVSKWRGDRMNALVEAETFACQEVAAWFEREVR